MKMVVKFGIFSEKNLKKQMKTNVIEGFINKSTKIFRDLAWKKYTQAIVILNNMELWVKQHVLWFPARLISRNDDKNWPPGPWDLTPLD